MLNKEKSHRVKEFTEHAFVISFFILSLILEFIIIVYVPYGIFIIIAILSLMLLFF